MSAPTIRIAYNIKNQLLIHTKQRFSWDNHQIIARASAGCFGSVYNPGRTKTAARGLRHRADQYRAHIRGLTDRKTEVWKPIPPEFLPPKNTKDKSIMKKINILLKANNTYQTPKK
eukprot:UN04839